MATFTTEDNHGTLRYLATKNAHIRDKDITFEEGPHIYTVMGDRGGYTSVTTWNHLNSSTRFSFTCPSRLAHANGRSEQTRKHRFGQATRT